MNVRDEKARESSVLKVIGSLQFEVEAPENASDVVIVGKITAALVTGIKQGNLPGGTQVTRLALETLAGRCNFGRKRPQIEIAVIDCIQQREITATAIPNSNPSRYSISTNLGWTRTRR